MESERVLRWFLVLILFLPVFPPVVRPLCLPLNTERRDMFSSAPSTSIPTYTKCGEVMSGGSPKLWIPFDIEASPRSPQIEMLKSDEDSCVISTTVYGMYRERMEIEGEIFDELTIPGCGSTNELGRPRLPVIRGMIEVPSGKKVGVTRVVHHEELSRHFINFCQDSSFASSEEADEVICISDQNPYSTDLYYPDKIVSVGQPAQLRGHTVVQVSIYPVRFNRILNKLNVSKHIKIELKFNNLSEDPIGGQERLFSNAFEEICRDVIWNHQISSQTCNLETLQQSLGYLVISTDPFYSYLDSFVDWKESNGLIVTSTKMPMGVHDGTVYNCISNAYNHWNPPPTYVLLVGDVEYMPTHYGLVGVDGSLTATDHYYSCVDGDDYLPDLFVGRLSVKNVTELNNTLNKLMSYGGFHNNHATMTVDIRCYTGQNVEVVDSVCSRLCNRGYIVDKFLGGHSAQNISDSVNEGRAIVNYYGGGSHDRWLGPHPDFTCSDILELTNEGEYPIVFSFCCWTGCYDYSSDCLGETWIKSDRKGSVAFFGSSREAEGPWINEMQKGAYKAIFDDSLNEFGAIATKAKLYMYNALGDLPINDTEIHFEIFNVLTDPQLNVFPSPKYTLSLSCTSNGEINPAPRRYTYCNKQNISVEATPEAGYCLDRWELDGETVEPCNPINVVMNSSQTLRAIFAGQPYEVTLGAYCNVQGEDVGVNITMDGSSTGYTTPHMFRDLTGTHKFTLPNIDIHGHFFRNWNTKETNTTITVNSGGTYTANYDAKFNMTITVTTGGITNPVPGIYTYWRESLVSIQAIPDAGYYLDRWELDGATIEPYNYTSVYLETNHSLRAVFIQLDPGHDIAIKGFSSKTVIGQGCSSVIKTLFVNVGSYTEIFNATIYVNETLIDSHNLTLQSGASTIVTFVWNTTGFLKGNYTLTAYAWPIPNETNTSNNVFAGGWAIITMIGDLTGEKGWPDGKCDMRDIGIVALGFGANRVTNKTDPRYDKYWHPTPCDKCPHNPNCDVIHDGKIDMKDIGTTARHFGETDS